MKKQNVLSCQFTSWFEQFKSVTFRSRVLDLPKEVIQYLLADGLVLPDGCEEVWDRTNVEGESDDEVDWSQSTARTAKGPDLFEFQQKIKDSLAELGGRAYPKLNWSSPKDAVWISFNNTMMCTSPRDVWLLLKSSDFITHDLTQPFKDCTDHNEGDKTNIHYQLVMRKWVNIVTGMEFRCFVYDKNLIAISQRDHQTHFAYIGKQEKEILRDITQFFINKISPKYPEYDYVFDVYIKNPGEVLVVDFGPYGPTTDGLLFEWDELTDGKIAERTQGEAREHSESPVFRFVRSEAELKGNQYAAYKVPQDFVHLASGEDANKLCDILKGLKTRAPEGVADEESDDSTDPSIYDNPFTLPPGT